MKYGPLGSSGVQVSEVCLGTVSHHAGGRVRAAPGSFGRLPRGRPARPGGGPDGAAVFFRGRAQMTWGEQNTEAEAWEQLDAFVEAGGNFIDTAELYPVPPVRATAGRTERFIGNWLASKPPGFREKLVIATKVSRVAARSAVRSADRALT